MPGSIPAHSARYPEYMVSGPDMTRSCVRGETERSRGQDVMKEMTKNTGFSPQNKHIIRSMVNKVLGGESSGNIPYDVIVVVEHVTLP